MGADAEKFLTQAAFARRRGVTRKTVTLWKSHGLLKVTDAGLVDVEQTEWNLDQRPAKYRGGVAHSPVRTLPEDERPARPAALPKTSTPTPTADESEVDDEALFDPDDPNLDLPSAVRRKENWLGLARKQAVEKEGRLLVDRAAAEALFFATARDLRDAWLSWPARVAVTMADELSVDPRALTTVLTAHVQQHLSELGEPEAQL